MHVLIEKILHTDQNTSVLANILDDSDGFEEYVLGSTSDSGDYSAHDEIEPEYRIPKTFNKQSLRDDRQC